MMVRVWVQFTKDGGRFESTCRDEICFCRFTTFREGKSFTLVKSEERKNMSATQRRWSVACIASVQVGAELNLTARFDVNLSMHLLVTNENINTVLRSPCYHKYLCFGTVFQPSQVLMYCPSARYYFDLPSFPVSLGFF